METPSPYTAFGQKGVGEGGAIGPAAAIANAVNDALKIFGVEICEIPITPPRIVAALQNRDLNVLAAERHPSMTVEMVTRR